MKTTRLTLALSTPLLLSCADPADDTGPGAALPVEYSTYLVYISDGTYDPADPTFVAPTLDELARDTWGWSDEQIAQFEQDAKDFFLERFGVDVDDPANVDRFDFLPVVLEPRANYRVVTMGNEDVPPEGWEVTDGSWQVIFDDPNGYELEAGDLPGYVVPPGGFIVYGFYQIEDGSDDKPFIGFKSYSPLVYDQTGLGSFRCQLWSEEFGNGLSFGVFRQFQAPDGDVTFDIRNVLTFE